MNDVTDKYLAHEIAASRQDASNGPQAGKYIEIPFRLPTWIPVAYTRLLCRLGVLASGVILLGQAIAALSVGEGPSGYLFEHAAGWHIACMLALLAIGRYSRSD